MNVVIASSCIVCGKGIRSYNGGYSWVHYDLEYRCASPGVATPPGEWLKDKAHAED